MSVFSAVVLLRSCRLPDELVDWCGGPERVRALSEGWLLAEFADIEAAERADETAARLDGAIEVPDCIIGAIVETDDLYLTCRNANGAYEVLLIPGTRDSDDLFDGARSGLRAVDVLSTWCRDAGVRADRDKLVAVCSSPDGDALDGAQALDRLLDALGLSDDGRDASPRQQDSENAPAGRGYDGAPVSDGGATLRAPLSGSSPPSLDDFVKTWLAPALTGSGLRRRGRDFVVRDVAGEQPVRLHLHRFPLFEELQTFYVEIDSPRIDIDPRMLTLPDLRVLTSMFRAKVTRFYLDMSRWWYSVETFEQVGEWFAEMLQAHWIPMWQATVGLDRVEYGAAEHAVSARLNTPRDERPREDDLGFVLDCLWRGNFDEECLIRVRRLQADFPDNRWTQWCARAYESRTQIRA